MRLSAFIIEEMERILQEWEDFARSLGEVTSSMDITGLRNHARLILTAIAADIETPQTSAEQSAKSKGRAPARAAHLPPTWATSHGAIRAEEGFTLQQMVSEYRALRASVLRLWAGEAILGDDPESYEQQVRFNEAIDEALADSIKTYSHAVDQMRVTKARHRMEALGTLSAGLGHDMTNILLPMRVCLDELTREGLTPTTTPLVESLRRAVNHLSSLSKGLRGLAMDPDQPPASPATALPEWWANAISPFTWVLPRGVRLHAEGLEHADLPPVLMPAHVLMQAVFNLVQNAAQALGRRNAANPGVEPHGNIWITAEHKSRAPGANAAHAEGTVYLTVRDDGPGMDAEAIAHCTEAFYTTNTSHGMGLGLFLVRTLMERHEGRLHIESQLGKGSAFTLIMPAASVASLTIAVRATSGHERHMIDAATKK